MLNKVQMRFSLGKMREVIGLIPLMVHNDVQEYFIRIKVRNKANG
jgi:hypothetical protein